MPKISEANGPSDDRVVVDEDQRKEIEDEDNPVYRIDAPPQPQTDDAETARESALADSQAAYEAREENKPAEEESSPGTSSSTSSETSSSTGSKPSTDLSSPAPAAASRSKK